MKEILFKAIKEGDLTKLKNLKNNYDKEYIIKILNKDANKILKLAAAKGHLDIFKWVYNKISNEVIEDIRDNDYTISMVAARKGHIEILNFFSKKLLKNESTKEIFRYNHLEAILKSALEGGRIDVLNWVKAQIKKDKFLSEITKVLDLTTCIINGDVNIIYWIEKEIGNDKLTELLFRNNLKAFYAAIRTCNKDVIECLATCISPFNLHRELQNNSCYILGVVAESGNIEALEWCYKICPEKVEEAITLDYILIIGALKYGKYKVLEWAEDKVIPDNYIIKILEGFSEEVFIEIVINAIDNEYLGMLNWLSKKVPHSDLLLEYVFLEIDFAIKHALNKGNIDILNLIEAIITPLKMKLVLQEDNYSMVKNILFKADIDIVNTLKWIHKIIQKEGMINALQPEIINLVKFRKNNKFNEVVCWVAEEISKEVVNEALVKLEYDDYENAILKGNTRKMELMQKRFPEREILKFLSTSDYKIITRLITSNKIISLEWIKSISSQLLLDAFKANNYAIFRNALLKNESKTILFIKEILKEDVVSAVRAEDYEAVAHAINRNEFEFITKILKDDLLNAVNSGNYDNFVMIMKHGKRPEVKKIIIKYLDSISFSSFMLGDYISFANNLVKDKLEVLKFISKISKENLIVALKVNNYSAFINAAKNGRIDILDFISDLLSENELINAFKANDYEAFLEAGINGHAIVLNWMYLKFSDVLIDNAISIDQYKALKSAAIIGKCFAAAYMIHISSSKNYITLIEQLELENRDEIIDRLIKFESLYEKIEARFGNGFSKKEINKLAFKEIKLMRSLPVNKAMLNEIGEMFNGLPNELTVNILLKSIELSNDNKNINFITDILERQKKKLSSFVEAENERRQNSNNVINLD